MVEKSPNFWNFFRTTELALNLLTQEKLTRHRLQIQSSVNSEQSSVMFFREGVRVPYLCSSDVSFVVIIHQRNLDH